MQRLGVWISQTGLRFDDYGGYESRNASTMRMITDAWERYIRSDEPSPERHLLFATNDVYEPDVDFSYGIPSIEYSNKCFPHFLFDSWPETGISNYQTSFDAMVDAGALPPVDTRVFWRGALTNSFRATACTLAKDHPDRMDFQLMKWNRTDPSNLTAHTPTYVPMTRQCSYRVLVDLGAGGFSARLPLLFASGRPVILLERHCEAWFYWDMKPWVHYIPSTEAGLLEAVNWSHDHPKESEIIGKQGQAYAKEHLTYEAVIRRCADLLRGSCTL